MIKRKRVNSRLEIGLSEDCNEYLSFTLSPLFLLALACPKIYIPVVFFAGCANSTNQRFFYQTPTCIKTNLVIGSMASNIFVTLLDSGDSQDEYERGHVREWTHGITATCIKTNLVIGSMASDIFPTLLDSGDSYDEYERGHARNRTHGTTATGDVEKNSFSTFLFK